MSINSFDLRKRLLTFWTEEQLKKWLWLPHPQLNGELPIDVIKAGRSEEIEKILDRMESGAYL